MKRKITRTLTLTIADYLVYDNETSSVQAMSKTFLGNYDAAKLEKLIPSSISTSYKFIQLVSHTTEQIKCWMFEEEFYRNGHIVNNPDHADNH